MALIVYCIVKKKLLDEGGGEYNNYAVHILIYTEGMFALRRRA